MLLKEERVMNKSILIVGVGGQGTLLASRILGQLAVNKGLDCKLSEVHGMSQRGGSVVTNVKIADKVLSPIIGLNDADIILAFEQLEAIRYTNYLKKGGVIVVNTQKIMPMPVIIGARDYPDNIIPELEKRCKVVAVNALDIANEIGSVKCVNVVMIGALAKQLGLSFEEIDEALKQTIKPNLYELNRKALEKGYNL